MKRQQVGPDRWGKRGAKRETTAISISSSSLSSPAALPIVCLPKLQQQSSNLPKSTVSSQKCPSELKVLGKKNKLISMVQKQGLQGCHVGVCLSKAWNRRLKTATKYLRAKG